MGTILYITSNAIHVYAIYIYRCVPWEELFKYIF